MDDGNDAFGLLADDGDGKPTVPKLARKFQPKIGGRLIKQEVKVEETTEAKVPVDLVEEGSGHAPVVQEGQPEDGGDATEVVMGEAEEDPVVREIDVFLNRTPIDDHTQLFILQYPQRPFWRPYEFLEKCEEVRVKPNQMKFEFELAVDKDSENYNNDDRELDEYVQILSSSKVPLVTSYAVGVMKQNQLHLNPVQDILQLRPSVRFLKSGKIPKKTNDGDSVETSVEVNRANVENSSGESSSEAWAKFKYCPADHPSSTIYQQKLITEETTPMQFDLNAHDYVDSICPLKSRDSDETSGPSKRVLLSMPLDERIRFLFEKGPQVRRFDALMHFAPDSSVDEVLELLLRYAELVQGLWVSKSSLICEGPDVKARNLILALFSKSCVIKYEDLERRKIKPDVQNRIMSPLAKRRPLLNNWILKEPKDWSFIKCYPNIVSQQEMVWLNRKMDINDALDGFRKGEKNISDALGGFGKGKGKLTMEHRRLSSCNAVPVTGDINHGPSRMNLDERQGIKSISDEAQDVLAKAIVKVLHAHKVCSLSMINQRLQELALSESTAPKVDSRIRISSALDASKSVLKDLVCQVATQIHDVYVLKSVGNQALDPFRSVVITLYRGNEHKAKLKKAEIMAAAEIVLKSDISTQVYSQVMNELCVFRRGCWVLKRGDGNPD